MNRWTTTCAMLTAFMAFSADAAPKKTTKRAKTARFHDVVLQADAPESGTLNGTWRMMSSPEGSEAMRVDRILGCFGDRDRARQRVLDPKGMLSEPTFEGTSFKPGVFDKAPLGEAACVIDDEPEGQESFDMTVDNWDTYLQNSIFECGCGDCYLFSGDGPPTLVEDPEAAATDEHRAQYAEYKTQQTERVAKAKVAHNEYAANYGAWKADRAGTLKTRAVRVAISAEKKIPAGRVSVYQYDWSEYRWCGDLNEATRGELVEWRVDHPAIPAGRTFELWVDGVETSHSWGVVHARDDAGLDAALEAIRGEAELRHGQQTDPAHGLPASLTGRAVETSLGSTASMIDECCAC